MNNREIATRLKEDTEYQEFFKAALKKFGSKTPADMDDEEKKKFFNYIESEWTTEDPATDDGDVEENVECEACKKKKYEEKLRIAIRKEIATALKGE